jgi:hypothetical protein
MRKAKLKRELHRSSAIVARDEIPGEKDGKMNGSSRRDRMILGDWMIG